MNAPSNKNPKPDTAFRPRIRSPQYDTPRGGKPLTDAAILRYILAGHYGEARRLAAVANLPKKRAKRAPSTLSQALKLLKNP
jgi:hypothetical protein